ncbi:hypothetical protein WJX82_008557 [Trebouxia sp. C0006]
MTASVDREELDGSHSHTGLARLKSASKSRKPYTITKQRERWTDSEHELFLEALKLYGRAWRSIQEHIGSKTTVQIRSHAQKFFTKLEKQRRPQRAGAVAATAAFQVIQAAGKEVQAQLQASPPKGFPFFGMAPSALLSLSQADLQLSKAGSLSEAARSSLLLSAQMSATNPSDVQLQPAGSIEGAADSARVQNALASFAAQRLKAVDRSSDLSETLSEHPPNDRACAASPMPAKANQQSFTPSTGTPRPDAFQALQAAAQHAQQAMSHRQVPLPALYSQQRQQATSMWAPFLALYQMQAMMGGGLGDGMFPPTASGVAADQFMQQAQHAQQAQQALMLAAQQMASVGTSRAAPQSLGIAMGAGVGQVSSLLGNAQASLPQGLASTRSTSLPALQSTWLASGNAANPFAVPVPASSINPSWLAPHQTAPKVDGSDR